MPMHDWSVVDPSIYHHFHQRWAAAIADELNAGVLPTGFSALLEQFVGGVAPDILTVERRPYEPSDKSALATLPRTRVVLETQIDPLLKLASRVAIRHRLGEVVCVIEIVSPGNKASRHAIGALVGKTQEFLRAGVNVLLIDPFPPGPRDPQSLHKLIWDEYEEVPFALPKEEPLLLAAYRAGDSGAGTSLRANIEPLAVGASIPDMPAWLDTEYYVNVPLERSYETAWRSCPADLRYFIEHGRLP